MIESCTFKQFNLQLIDFTSIYRSIEIDLINDLSKYQLLNSKIINRDIKKLLYHHIFHGLCEYLLALKTKERVIILKTNCTDALLMLQYFKENDIQKHIDQVVIQIAKLLPISIYGYTKDSNFEMLRKLYNKHDIKFSQLKEAYDKRDGNAVELIERLRNFLWNKDFMRSHYTFARVKSFAKRNNLTFLSEKYFNQLKTKQLLFI